MELQCERKFYKNEVSEKLFTSNKSDTSNDKTYLPMDSHLAILMVAKMVSRSE